MPEKKTKKEPKPKHEKKPAKPKAQRPAAKARIQKKADGLKRPAKALILSFRRGAHNQNTRQFLLEVTDCDTRAKAAKFVGRKVVWTSPGKKQIVGKVTSPHGNSGVLRARFSKGLPGTAITQKVRISG